MTTISTKARCASDYSLPNDMVLTSISAYSEYDQTSKVDADGLTLQNLEYISAGDIRSFSQELRLAGVIGERSTLDRGCELCRRQGQATR